MLYILRIRSNSYNYIYIIYMCIDYMGHIYGLILLKWGRNVQINILIWFVEQKNLKPFYLCFWEIPFFLNLYFWLQCTQKFWNLKLLSQAYKTITNVWAVCRSSLSGSFQVKKVPICGHWKFVLWRFSMSISVLILLRGGSQ